MTEEDRLEDRFRTLARAVPQNASPAVEERLRAAFRLRVNQGARLWGYVARVAASAVLAASLYLVWSQWTHRKGSDQQVAAIAPARQGSEFIALPYAQSEVPLEQPVIVRVQIPASELGLMGMPLAHATAGERVNADLLVGQDGIARAVRLVESQLE
jgi:hypothetical protein